MSIIISSTITKPDDSQFNWAAKPSRYNRPEFLQILLLHPDVLVCLQAIDLFVLLSGEQL